MDTKEEIVLLERKLELLREISLLESQRQQPVYPIYPTWPTQPNIPWVQPNWYSFTTSGGATLTTSGDVNE